MRKRVLVSVLGAAAVVATMPVDARGGRGSGGFGGGSGSGGGYNGGAGASQPSRGGYGPPARHGHRPASFQ